MPTKSSSNCQIRAERCAQDALFRWMVGNDRRIRNFVRALPDSVAHWFDAWSGSIQVSQNERTDSGGFMDIVFRGGTRALVMEIKIKHRENPFQYSHYRGFLTRKGFETKAVGLLPNKLASRGLIDAVLVQTADARISWGGLLSRLRLASRSAKEVSELLEQLVIIYPDVAAGTWVGTPVKPAERAMASVGDGADTLAVLVRDLIEQLPPGCIAFPDQAGNAPPVLRMGKSSWAEWFEDEDETRILLNFDIPRRSKAMSQLHFEFCIELFSKTYAGLVS